MFNMSNHVNCSCSFTVFIRNISDCLNENYYILLYYKQCCDDP